MGLVEYNFKGNNLSVNSGDRVISMDRFFLWLTFIVVILSVVSANVVGKPHKECSPDMDEKCIEIGTALDVEVNDEWTCRELCGFYGGVGFNCHHWFSESKLCFCCED